LRNKLAELKDKIILKNFILKESDPLFKYLTVEISNTSKCKPIVKYNHDAIEKKLENVGWMVAISNFIRSSKKAIEIYRGKDVVEKAFYLLKNLLDFDRIRCHSDIAMNNKMFIIFISLILISHVSRVMSENNLFKDMTMKELIKTIHP
jgi:transposase